MHGFDIELPKPASTHAQRSTQVPNGFEQNTACENGASHASCTLSDVDRANRKLELVSRCTGALSSYLHALQSARTEALLQKSAGWGLFGDIVYAGLSASLMFGIEIAATNVALRILGTGIAKRMTGAIDAGALATTAAARVSSAVKQGTTIARSQLTRLFAAMPEGAIRKEQFVEALAADAPAMFETIEGIILAGDDAALLAGIQQFDPAVMNPVYFRGAIEAAFDRFEALKLHELGWQKTDEWHTEGHREVIWLRAYGKARLAVVKYDEKTTTMDHGDFKSRPRSYFEHWVEPAFEYAAISAQAKLGPVREVDATGSDFGFDDPNLAVLSWVTNARVAK
jgi:hypothetical protein